MRVLIIDDNEINVAILRNLVMRLPAEPVCYTNSAQALEWCHGETPDLVLVDYMMPSPDGIEFIVAFRSLPGFKEIPVVMVTAANEKDVRYKALEIGATDFLTKPIDNIELLARARNLLELRRSQKALTDRAAWLAEEVHKATKEIIARERELIFRLTKATEYRSPETGAHILRMALYSKAIAAHLGLSAEEQEILLTAAPMHDIGKVGTPDTILLKDDTLSDPEYEIMKEHTIMGYEILQGSKSKLIQVAAEIALSHHEKYDGTGYPNGLAGDDIPIFARICSVSDVFDALTTERAYKKAWSLEDAVREVERRVGADFDPRVVDAFKDALPEILKIYKHYSDQAAMVAAN